MWLFKIVWVEFVIGFCILLFLLSMVKNVVIVFCFLLLLLVCFISVGSLVNIEGG